MANHASAKKRIRQNENRNIRNRGIRSRVRTLVKGLRSSISENNKSEAQASLKTVIGAIDSAVKKGVYHRSTGSRYISRLSAQVSALK